MSTGSMLYLAMCIAAFAVFGAVLAYYSWQQSKLGRDYLPVPEAPPIQHDPVHAEAA